MKLFIIMILMSLNAFTATNDIYEYDKQNNVLSYEGDETDESYDDSENISLFDSKDTYSHKLDELNQNNLDLSQAKSLKAQNPSYSQRLQEIGYLKNEETKNSIQYKAGSSPIKTYSK